MDFELTKSQKEIQKAAREFAKGEFDKELALELDRKHEFPTKIWQKAADLGFIGVHYPESIPDRIWVCWKISSSPTSSAPGTRLSAVPSFSPALPPSVYCALAAMN